MILPSRTSRRRRWLWPMAVTALVVSVAVLSAALVRTDTREELDPRSASPGGSRAVAEVLRRQGVEIERVTRSDQAVDGADSATTIAVFRPQLLGPQQLRRLTATTAELVLVEPDLVVLSALTRSVTPAGSGPAGSIAPACPDPDAMAAGTVSGGGMLYTATGRATGCYPAAGAPERFSFVRLSDDNRRITVLGQRQVLQNTHLAFDGNAALALRVLGTHPTLRWYLPDPAELGRTGGPTLTELLPPWVGWAFAQLVIVLGFALAWCARRLGPVVAEPLPVVVRSAETVEGRARLYRTGRARGRAAAVLRTAAVRRLAARLGVPTDALPEEVAQLTATATGLDATAVHRTLLGDPPPHDAALVALADELDSIERAVSAPTPPDRYRDPAQAQRHDRRHSEGTR